MKLRLILPAFFFVLAIPAFAEDPADMFSDEVLQQVAAAVIADQEASSSPARGQNSKPYWVMYAWLGASTIYDVEATFYRLSHCDECREGNPIIRPFIERGRLETYAFSAAVNGLVMYIARRMYNSGDPWWRVGPLTFTIIHGVAGTLNLLMDKHEKT